MLGERGLCRCSRSLGAICGLFAALAVGALLAEDRCLDAGGRVSEAGWVCELASGASASLWSSLTPLTVVAVAVAVGVPVYFLVNALGQRLIARMLAHP